VVTAGTTGKASIGCPRSQDAASSAANLLGWLFRKRWNFGRRVRATTLESARRRRLSIWAVALVAADATVWSAVASLGLLGWDPHYYYSVVEDRTWAQVYPFEQVMFWLVSIFHPWSFASYEFFAIAISLSILLFAFYRLGYSPLDQFVLVFFFCSSFYGLHFVLTFQRQFFGLVLFLLAVSGQKSFLLARILSLFSQLFTFSVHIFWELRRFSATASAAAVLLIVPIAMALAGLLPDDKAAHYGGYGEDSPLHLVLKQSLTVGLCLIVLATLEHGDNALRSLTAAYIALSLPVVFWPFYAGVFARLDYFFLPLIVAFWPRYVQANRLILCRVSIIGFTIVGFALWMKLNSQCVVIGDCTL
jgi:hypothetical protein